MSTVDREFLGFGQVHATKGDHIANFFESSAQGLDLLVSYMKTGLEAGQRCIHFVGMGYNGERVLEGLSAAGVDVAAFEKDQQLTIVRGLSTEELPAFVETAMRDVPDPYPLIRCSGEFGHDWCAAIRTIRSPPALFFCQCEIQHVLGNVVIDAFRSHPMCIVGGTIHQNPFYHAP